MALFDEKGIAKHVTFKGGTMLRRTVFGPRDRFSTDLDFTACTDATADDLMIMMPTAIAQPFRGMSFRFDRDYWSQAINRDANHKQHSSNDSDYPNSVAFDLLAVPTPI